MLLEIILMKMTEHLIQGEAREGGKQGEAGGRLQGRHGLISEISVMV